MMKLGMLVAPVNPYIGSGLFVLGYQYVGTGAVNIKDGTEKQPWLIDRAKQGAATVGLPPEIVDTMELLLSMGGAQLAANADALGTTKLLLPGTPPPAQLPGKTVVPGYVSLPRPARIDNGALRNFIAGLYSKAGKSVGEGCVGTGSLADYIRATGTHIQKAQDAIRYLEKIIEVGKLMPNDVEIAKAVILDLKHALQNLPLK